MADIGDSLFGSVLDWLGSALFQILDVITFGHAPSTLKSRHDRYASRKAKRRAQRHLSGSMQRTPEVIRHD